MLLLPAGACHDGRDPGNPTDNQITQPAGRGSQPGIKRAC